MHQYLRSVGFSLYNKKHDIEKLLDGMQEQYKDSAQIITSPGGEVRYEIHAPIAEDMGVCMVGEVDNNGNYAREYYYPYMYGKEVSSKAPCSIQRHVDHDIYSGLLDDNRVGISLIFRLDNTMDYLDRVARGVAIKTVGARLSAFSSDGKILLPVKKTVQQKQISKLEGRTRDGLIEAAKNGDESAMEKLTVEDMNTYAMVSRRLIHEDIYTIIDSCFMPQGIECDLYSVVGDITAIDVKQNSMTGEEIFDFTLDCNDVIFHVGINKADLTGDPDIGRRFKGRIWMQGRVSFA